MLLVHSINMNVDNSFLTLGKYKYKHNKRKNKDEEYLNEQENYFTESFKVILGHYENIYAEFVSLLLSQKNIDRNLLGDFVGFETQRRESYG